MPPTLLTRVNTHWARIYFQVLMYSRTLSLRIQISSNTGGRQP